MARNDDARPVAARSTRAQVLSHRLRTHELDRGGETRSDAAVLDLGVQDTGPDGALWALRLRGWDGAPEHLVTAWTLRGAPHVYRRGQVAEVAAAVAPWSDIDAGKRIFDAARPLRAAGIGILDALDEVGAVMRDVVEAPTVKGQVSGALSARLPAPYLRHCRPCDAVHTYEQPFRLAALRVGLELEPGTSPPVLRRLPGWRGPAAVVPPALDPVRAVLHLLGPATPKEVAGYVDTVVAEVRAHWPRDVVPVEVDGVVKDVLEGDLASLEQPTDPPYGVALLGPFDAYLQARDRELLVPDDAARADLWRTLGRPGAVLAAGELVGSWRPRTARGALRVEVTTWGGRDLPTGLEEAAERLAAFRGVTFAGVA